MSQTPEEKKSLEAQIMELRVAGEPEYKVAEKLGVSRYKVRKICQSKEYKAALEEVATSAKKEAAHTMLTQLSELAPLALKALKHNLEQNKMEAVRTFAEIVGLKDHKDDTQKDSVINLILPGGRTEKIIDTEGKEVPNE